MIQYYLINPNTLCSIRNWSVPNDLEVNQEDYAMVKEGYKCSLNTLSWIIHCI